MKYKPKVHHSNSFSDQFLSIYIHIYNFPSTLWHIAYYSTIASVTAPVISSNRGCFIGEKLFLLYFEETVKVVVVCRSITPEVSMASDAVINLFDRHAYLASLQSSISRAIGRRSRTDVTSKRITANGIQNQWLATLE